MFIILYVLTGQGASGLPGSVYDTVLTGQGAGGVPGGVCDTVLTGQGAGGLPGGVYNTVLTGQGAGGLPGGGRDAASPAAPRHAAQSQEGRRGHGRQNHQVMTIHNDEVMPLLRGNQYGKQ